MRISDWSSDVCSSDLYPITNREFTGIVAPKQKRHSSFALMTDKALRKRAGQNNIAIAVWRATECAGVALKGSFVRNVLDAQAKVFLQHRDRKSVVSGKSVSVRVDLGCRRNIKKKTTIKNKK